MGWFSKSTPETSDPVGVICRRLESAPLEWKSYTPDGDGGEHGLRHRSGVAVEWDQSYLYYPDVWYGGDDVGWMQAEKGAAQRLYAAVQSYIAALLTAEPATPDATAAALARAVLAGDRAAVGPLVDRLRDVGWA